MPEIRKPVAADIARLLLVSAIWGSAFICISIALADFAPLAIACWRILLATAVVLLVCHLKSLSVPLDHRSLALFALIGSMNTLIPFTLISWGQLTVDSATTALLLALTPFVTLLLSHFFTHDDRFSWNRFVGLCTGFVGVFLLFAHEALFSGGALTGMATIVLASSLYAASALIIRQLAHLPSLVIVAGSLGVTSVVALPLLLIFYPPWQQTTTTSSLLALGFLALGPTAAAYVLRARIVQLNGAVFMSNAGFLIPLFATLWSWLFFSALPTTVMWLAMTLIFLGIFLGRRHNH